MRMCSYPGKRQGWLRQESCHEHEEEKKGVKYDEFFKWDSSFDAGQWEGKSKTWQLGGWEDASPSATNNFRCPLL